MTLKEHGLLFTAPMVRAILAGQKSQTRRTVKAQSAEAAHVWADNGDGTWSSGWRGDGGNLATLETVRAPHGPVGRRLWVRETWADVDPDYREMVGGKARVYRADYDPPADGDYGMWRRRQSDPFLYWNGKWKPSIYMPRDAARITLEVTRVRVERVGDISEEDVRAEGVQMPVAPAGEGKVSPLVQIPTPYAKRMDADWTEADYWRAAYAHLWDEINGAGSWISNPWVWVYDFRRVT